MSPAVSATVIVPTAIGGDRLRRLLESLEAQTAGHQVIVVDNACPPAAIDPLTRDFPAADFLRLPRNAGFSRAINLAAARADGEALVLVNDDCTCEPGFVAQLSEALDPSRGIVMAAGVLCETRDPAVIDTAGMQLDATLLVFDYLNGRSADVLESAPPDPIGPCGAAAAFDRETFLDAGGFDETLFAYWEDVDLVLRLRQAGGRCALAAGARGLHAHSGTLGSGSSRKNYLVGFGRGYLVRRWSVLSSPRRAAAAVARDLTICAGQAVIDRNLAGVRGRVDGWRAAGSTAPRPYPAGLIERDPEALGRNLARRLRRRARIARGRRAGGPV